MRDEGGPIPRCANGVCAIRWPQWLSNAAAVRLPGAFRSVRRISATAVAAPTNVYALRATGNDP